MLVSFIVACSCMPLKWALDGELWRRLDTYPTYGLLCALKGQPRLNPYLKARVARTRFPLTVQAIYQRALAFQSVSKPRLLRLIKIGREREVTATDGFDKELWKDRVAKLDEQLFVSYRWPTDPALDWRETGGGQLQLEPAHIPAPMRGRFRNTDEEWRILATMRNPHRTFSSFDTNGLVPTTAQRRG